MANFVLVAGAFHGAWTWEPVARLLRAEGHVVHPVDLTGQGARADEATPETDLSTHVEDVVRVIEDNDLRDVILVGHSYSGMVVTGAADRARDRVAELVYADAMVPEDGQSAEDFSGPVVTQAALDAADGDWLVSNFFPIAKFGPFADLAAQQAFEAKLVKHPMKTFFEKLHLRHAPLKARTFISSKADPIALFDAVSAHAEASGDWTYYSLPTGHDAMLTDPQGFTRILLERSTDRPLPTG